MLHVFHLDAGRMLPFRVDYAAENVSSLNEAIFREIGAPCTEQILVISGGEVLDSSKKVSTYSAGVDSSNPIFLIYRSELDAKPSNLPVDSQTLKEMESLVVRQQSTSQQPSFATIQTNVQIAKRFVSITDDEYSRCSQLVNDQHLIHQGWLAVIANLDDTTNAFRQRIDRYRERHNKFLLQKTKANELLKNFAQDLLLLKRIPLLNCLIEMPTSATASTTSTSMTLFDWISSKEPESSLNELAEDTKKTLDQILEPKVVENLTHWETMTLERTQDAQMKEIKGLGRRLDQLNEYFELVKKIRGEQHQYADMIGRQEQQATTTRDSSILAQLCVSQLDVLKFLLTNQNKLSDICRRFFDAKRELLNNIRVRLQWVTDTHQCIHTADSKVLLNGERLRKLRRQLQLLRQLHDAPIVYASAVGEILRRKLYSREFLEWAERLTGKSRSLHSDENRLRETFAEKLDGHFLRSLFNGLDDKAPKFCTETPEPFDIHLPPVDVQHVREIRQSVPQLASLLQVCQPQVYERMSMNDWKTTEATGATLRRDVSFFSQTPPKYFQMALNRSCQSPSWMSGDEFSPNTTGGGVLFHTADGETNTIVPSDDIEHRDNEIVEISDLPRSNTNTARSAPIKIPSRAPSDTMTNSRHVSEKSSRFGTPDEGNLAEFGAASSSDPTENAGGCRRVSSPNLREIANMTQSMIGRVCQMNDVLPLGELALERSCILPDAMRKTSIDLTLMQRKVLNLQSDVAEQVKLLNESLEREKMLANRLKEAEDKMQIVKTNRIEIEHKMKNELAVLKSEVSSFATSLRQAFNDVRSLVDSFKDSSRHSAAESSEMVLRSVKTLEVNLQSSLAEVERASMAVQENEFQRRLDEFRDDLDKERSKFRESQKQLENCEAYLKQKDEVIELLQAKLNETEQEWSRRLEESKGELVKQFTIEHELDLESLRREFQGELDNKDNENQRVLQELRDKDQVIKQMRREQDKLVASVYEREFNGGLSSHSPDAAMEIVGFERMKNEDFEERLKQMKHDLEQSYKDKLQMLTAGLERKHVEQIERVKVEKEVELRMLTEQHRRDLTKLRENAIATSSAVADAVYKEETTMNERLMAHATEEGAYSLIGAHSKETVVANVVASDQQQRFDALDADEFAEATEVEDLSTIQQSVCLAMSTKGVSSPCDLASLCSKATQTRKDFTVNVLKFHIGDLVLVVFDPRMDTFVLFSVSPTLYILRESCFKSMGLKRPKEMEVSTTAPMSSADLTTKSNWSIGRLLDLDYCQIKKSSNRYNLPLGTRFYRATMERCVIQPKEEGKQQSSP